MSRLVKMSLSVILTLCLVGCTSSVASSKSSGSSASISSSSSSSMSRSTTPLPKINSSRNSNGYSAQSYSGSSTYSDTSEKGPGKKYYIKGNISFNTGERIYHMPGDAYYDETIIDESKGERWFSSPEEAEAAGWRRAYL